MLTWLYDAHGRAAAILDEFCLRTAAGEPVAWVFGLSVFSLPGEHLGWFEHGIFFDADNNMLGFVPALAGNVADLPVPAPAPAFPLLSKRPHVPSLRARPVRRPCCGWSRHGLAAYIAGAGSAARAANEGALEATATQASKYSQTPPPQPGVGVL